MSGFPTNPVSDSVLDDSSIDVSPRAAIGPARPDEIGPYRILELIGEGGMGEVYKAERRHPIRQTVAVKVIKLGFDSREIVGRFESERQALAMMDHPGIAKIIDAGTTLSGRPYFVMEYVGGRPITQFCEEHHLSVRDRLNLFGDACDAISHAHTKAIIHRDIKPSNVLAYLQDGKPAVKVIDFGVAKALTNGRLTDLTVSTAAGQAIGTFDCMSPEQVDGSPDIDTRSDVYSLGVLLYELLAGAKPFDQETLSTATVEELKRLIREVDPPKPSTRILQRAGSVSDRSGALAKQLHELEWIPLKAMRKERDRRYASALQLKEDVQNYLDGKPLLAGPETRSYRIRKFLKRNQRGVIAAVVMLLILIVGTTLYIHNIRAANAGTAAALIESERQRAEAQKQAIIASDSMDFLANIFRNADPQKSLGADVTIVQAMEQAAKSLDSGETKVRPVTEAMIRFVVGTTLRALGRYDEALPQLRRAQELDAKYRSPDDRQKWVTLSDLALLLTNQGKLAEAEPLYREALRLCRLAQPPEESEVAQALSGLASLLKNQGKYDESEKMMKEVLEIRRRILSPSDPWIPTSLNNLASLYWAQGKLDQAEPLVRESLQMRQASLPAGHPNIAQSLMNLGVLLRDQKKFTEAEPLCRQAVEMRRKVLPPTHPDLAVALDNLARVLVPLNKLDEAASLFRECVSIRKSALPAGDPRIADSLYRLANVLVAQRNLTDAEPLYRQALSIQQARDPKAGPTTQTIAALSDLLEKANRHDEAAALRSPSSTRNTSTRP
jgi:serine/threonine protein kinase